MTEFDKSECLFAIDSGAQGDKVQYIFLDYDDNYPTNLMKLMVDYDLKRALILETSEDRWSVISFTPTMIEDIFKLMWDNRLIDRGHAGCFLRFRQGSLRVSVKGNANGYPKIHKIVKNGFGRSFYDWNKEKDLRKLLKSFKRD